MNAIDKLTQQLASLPGIGPRQARRVVFFLLSRNDSWMHDFIHTLNTIKSTVHQCGHCLRHFEALGNINVCDICLNADKTKIMLVEKETDLENINKLGVYTGRYFILGSLLPVTSRKNIRKMNTDEFLKETERAVNEDELNEIILALPVNPEGDHTADYIQTQITQKAYTDIRITILGRGLSTGSELEYSDDATFKSALENRLTKD